MSTHLTAAAGVPAGNVGQRPSTTDRDWWQDAPRWAAEADRPAPDVRRASYRFGDVLLEVSSDYHPLLDDLDEVYGECAAPLGGQDGARVHCSARLIEGRSLVALRFDAPMVPDLLDAALGLVRPRRDYEHFSPRELELPGWRLLGNALDPAAPLLATGGNRTLINLRVEPPEFLLNYVVGVAQLAQPSVSFVHGGGVSVGGAGTLVTGRSGAGKSTTLVTLASHGYPLLGDETIGIRFPSGELLPFRSTLKLRPGPRPRALGERLAAVPCETRPDAAGLDCAWVKPGALFPDAPPAVPVPLHSVFFLRQFSQGASVEPFVPSLEHLELLQQLTMSFPTVVSWTPSPARRLMRFVRLIELFATRHCYFLDLGTPDETTALIERTVKETWH